MEEKIIRVAPSILAADFTNLDKDIKRVIKAKADWLHIDVMDGHFVPNISFGFSVTEAIKDYPIFKDFHLMISDPITYVDRFLDCNADLITFHVEALKYKKDVKFLINKIHQRGVACGISINPETPIDAVIPYLKDLDVVLVMSVHPGFGGQKFIEETYEKVSQLNKIIYDNCYDCFIEVDGGVNTINSKKLIEAGVDILVAGSAIFKAEDMKKAIKDLKANK